MSLAMPRENRGHLLNILGVSFGIAIAIGGMIGAGILRTPSLIAAEVPDGGLILALWAIGALHASLEANVICELSTAMPRAGGFYVYAHRAFGDVGGLVVGWTVWITRLASTSALSVAFADFLALLWPAVAQHTVLAAIVMQLAIYSLNVVGLREGQRFQQVTSLVKALALAAFCVVAFVTASPHAPDIAAMTPPLTVMGVIAAFQSIVGAYAGWFEPAFFAEENTDPGRNIPRAIFTGLAIAAVLYLAVNAALLHALGLTQMAHGALPYATVLTQVAGKATGTLFAAGAMFVVVSCANAGIMTAPRVLFALSRDGLLPAALRNVNKGGSPYVAFLMTACCSVLLTSTGSFGLLFGLIGTLGVAAFALTIASVFVLRRREPDLLRPYRAILYPWLPALALAIDVTLLVLFLNVDWRGGLYAVVMWLACIPFAMIARRATRSA
ncbi:MAG TPA: APC family permease [Rhizomicrobium sp.]